MLLMLVTAPEHADALVALGGRLATANKWPLRIWVSGEGKPEEPAFQSPEDFSSESPAGREVAKAVGELEGDLDIGLAEQAFPPSRPAMTRRVEGLKPRVVLLKHDADESEGEGGRHLSDHLYDHARVTVMLVRPGENGSALCRRVLLPAAGGPHGIAALRLFKGFPLEDTEVVSPFYVENDDFGELSEEVGLSALKRVMGKGGLKVSERIVPRVRLAPEFRKGLVEEMKEGEYDLVVIGATGSGRVRRYLFGSIPEKVLREVGGASVAVLRGGDPMLHRLRGRLERGLMLTVPQMGREDRLSLFETVETGSRWNFDFMTLMGLSTAIASLGLIQNSTAVVIGAMLVAPLMTPLLGVALGLVQRNLPLALRSAKAVGLGFVFALLIAVGMGAAAPLSGLTAELMGRVEPSLPDLGVGLFSGIAAAYCIARPRLSAALPGVAIAAALVPPIATAGISLGLGEYGRAGGAALLFSSNVVAIVLGAAMSFYFGGIRGNSRQKVSRRWATRVIWLLMLCGLGLSVPLGSRLMNQYEATRRHKRALVIQGHADLVERLAGLSPPARLVDVALRPVDGTTLGVVRLERAEPLTEGESARVAAWVREVLGEETRVRIRLELVRDL